MTLFLRPHADKYLFILIMEPQIGRFMFPGKYLALTQESVKQNTRGASLVVTDPFFSNRAHVKKFK